MDSWSYDCLNLSTDSSFPQEKNSRKRNEKMEKV